MTESIDKICWDVDTEASLADITQWCRSHRGVNRLMVVARPDNAMRGRLAEPRVAEAVSAIFDTSVLKATWTSGWPGTKLFRGRHAKIWTVNFDSDVQQRMVAVESSLEGWVHARRRPLPEDICLYRLGDALPTFISVTHEPEAWLLDGSAHGAAFARRSTRALPSALIPPPPEFFAP